MFGLICVTRLKGCLENANMCFSFKICGEEHDTAGYVVGSEGGRLPLTKVPAVWLLVQVLQQMVSRFRVVLLQK